MYCVVTLLNKLSNVLQGPYLNVDADFFETLSLQRFL